jgi:hypothetical protein
MPYSHPLIACALAAGIVASLWPARVQRALPSTAAAQSPAPAPDQTTVRFDVLDSLTDGPIEGALVELADGNWHARSDANGLVKFGAVPIGVRRIRVRAIGYEPVDRLLVIRAAAAGDSAATIIDVSPIPPMLDPQRTTATRRQELDADGGAFEMRRKMAIGNFFTWEDFNHQTGRTIADIIAARVASVHSDGSDLHSRREIGGCPLDIYIDGVHVARPFTLKDVDPFDVVAAEVYTPTNIPPQFNTPVTKTLTGIGGHSSGSPSCGVLLVWLRKY